MNLKAFQHDCNCSEGRCNSQDVVQAVRKDISSFHQYCLEKREETTAYLHCQIRMLIPIPIDGTC